MWAYVPKCDYCGKTGRKTYKQGETFNIANEDDFSGFGVSWISVGDKNNHATTVTNVALCRECSGLPIRTILNKFVGT